MSSNPDDWAPQALREVWEMKAAVQRRYEGMSTQEMIEAMRLTAEELLRSHGIVLPRAGNEARDSDLDRAAGEAQGVIMPPNSDEWAPQSLREVWEWKEAVAREYEGLSTEEMMRRMSEAAEASLREFGITLPRVSGRVRDEPDRAAG